MADYSLWAMPAEGTKWRVRLQRVISTVSREFNCSVFEPHVTVLGAFGQAQGLSESEVLERTRQFCRSLPPYSLKVKDMSSGSTYFQSVYLRMEPSREVLFANWAARRAMSIEVEPEEEIRADTGYMPHLSLIYGDLLENQKELVQQHALQLEPSIESDVSFSVSSLALYRTDPHDKTMASWEKLADFPLQGMGFNS